MKIRIIIMCVICIGLLGCSDKVQDISTAKVIRLICLITSTMLMKVKI